MSAPRLAVILAVSVLTVAPAVAWQQLVFKAGLRSLRGQADAIVAFGNEKRARAGSLSTPISDAELNAYFEYARQGPDPLRHRRAAAERARATDGSAARRSSTSMPCGSRSSAAGSIRWSYLTGSLPLTASGLLITKDGVGRFQLESAQVSGVSVPKSLLQELLGYYSRTPENPHGISMDDPFELPAHIREIQRRAGASHHRAVRSAAC